jgi:hypothetical protein
MKWDGDKSGMRREEKLLGKFGGSRLIWVIKQARIS